MGPSLFIVVLHYSGLEDTLECVASLGRQTYGSAHTVVVDNGTGAGLATGLAVDYPWVEVVELAENLGWSGGNNVGIRLAMERGYDIVCLLNNDTVVPERAIEGLMETTAFLPPCILHPAIDSYGLDDEVQLDPSISQPSFLTIRPVPGRPSLFEIDSVNGACLMVHTKVFQDIGLIDERFFLLCEDGDFGARAVKAGYRLYCETSVRIQHKESQSFGGRRKPIKTYYGIRNRLLCIEKHDRTSRKLLQSGRGLFWTASGLAGAAETQPFTWWGFVRWSFSSDIFARALRMGVRDFLLHRFGRINRRDEEILTGKMPAP